MNVTGLPLAEFARIVDKVSADSYGGNVRVHRQANAISLRRFRARLDVQDSRGVGARRSRSGRRTPAACWHAYRDVLTVLFDLYPDATVRTLLATYRGRDGFADTYPATGAKNVGSMMAPAFMPELCDCEA